MKETETWLFGERRGRTESELLSQMLWERRVRWGMMVYDSLRAIDYLRTRPDVDANRMGTLGLSMRSTMAWWVAEAWKLERNATGHFETLGMRQRVLRFLRKWS